MPSVPELNSYDVLGVARTAALDDIKKRYRELARKHHPDVNGSDPSAAQRFSEISLAYKTLSDADSRRALDAEISLREQRSQAAAARAQAASAGNSTAYNARTPSGTPPPQPSRSSGSGGNQVAESIRLSAEGRGAYLRDRPVEARNFAEQALRLNQRNADAWELLGDVFRRQGRTDEAINAYSMCLQVNPRHPNVMARLERMARASGSASSTQRGYYDTRDSGPSGSAAYGSSSKGGAYPGYGSGAQRGSSQASPGSGRASRLSEDKGPWGRLLAGVIGYGAAFMTILWTAIEPGNQPHPALMIGAISEWNANIIIALVLVGLLLGATMTITGVIRRIDEELILTGIAQRGGHFLPLGLLMIVFSILNFYAAAIIYALVTLLQETFTSSMVRVIGAVTIATALLALAYSPDHWQVLFFGGNVTFIAFVVGWLLGDFFRADVL